MAIRPYCHAVVIGAGHNGLVTAGYLARAGWAVVMAHEARGCAGPQHLGVDADTIVYTHSRGGVVEVEWDEPTVEHTRHGVAPEEVEEALGDPRRVGMPAYSVAGERRRALIA